MMWIKVVFGWIVFLLLFGNSGCQALNSGPRLMERVAEGVTATAGTLIARFDPTEMTAGADGSVNDPEFVLEGFVATGVVYKVTARLIGADLSFDIDAAGTGSDTVYPDVMSYVRETWGRSALSEDERKLLITEAIISGRSKCISSEAGCDLSSLDTSST